MKYQTRKGTNQPNRIKTKIRMSKGYDAYLKYFNEALGLWTETGNSDELGFTWNPYPPLRG